MPKIKNIESVTHDWIHKLTFQQQALLMTGIRGADNLPKHNAGKCIVRYIRGCTLKPAGIWSGLNDNDFMWGDFPLFKKYVRDFFNDPDQYPHHFVMHICHCSEVIGYKHPDSGIRMSFEYLYKRFCKAFHMNPESEEQMDKRLNDFGQF